MTRRPLPLALVLATAALALAACGGGDDGGGASPSATATTGGTGATTMTSTATTPAATTPDGIDTMPGAGTDPVTAPAKNTRTALLTGVRAARHEGYDRIVFEFRDALPGYDVRYVTPPVTQDGSGRPVPVDGAYALRIRMDNALDADLQQPSAPQTYTGPTRLKPGTPELAELARVGGFENVLTWVAGVRDRVDFRVSTLSSPPRLVVDLRNH